MRLTARKDPRFLLLLLFQFMLATIACQAFYQAAGMLPSPSPLPPTSTFTPLPSSTLTSTKQPTHPAVERITPFPTHPLFTLQPTVTPQPLELQRRVFQAVWETVRDTYLYPDFNGLNWDAVHQEYLARIETGVTGEEFYTLIDEMIYSLGDDHSFYLSPEQVAQNDAEYESGITYVGIGVMISAVPEHERAVILCVFPGSPAESAGLKPRDSILSADGEPILTEDGILKAIIRGPEETEVTIVVQTPGEEPREVTLKRSAITSHQPVPYNLLTSPEGKRIGYILLLTLADSTIDEQFADALKALTASAPLDGLIIDNTQNGGGTDTVAKSILGFFTSGTVGYFVSHEGERALQIRASEDFRGSQQIPLVVLIGPNTVSYGEVLAGVLQDVQRAYLIGETTDGNVETLWGYDFEDGSRLWLAHETFRPLNQPEANWEETGIIPDLKLPVLWDEFTVEDDPLVKAALDYIDNLQP